MQNYEFYLPAKKGARNVVLLGNNKEEALAKLERFWPGLEARYVGKVVLEHDARRPIRKRAHR